jgi:hypothetical protein
MVGHLNDIIFKSYQNDCVLRERGGERREGLKEHISTSIRINFLQIVSISLD